MLEAVWYPLGDTHTHTGDTSKYIYFIEHAQCFHTTTLLPFRSQTPGGEEWVEGEQRAEGVKLIQE